MTPFMSCGARLAVYALFAAAFFPSGGQNVVFALYLIGVAVAIGTGYVLKHTLLGGETTAFVMELPAYRMPHARDILLHTWGRLKEFVFGAGKIIVMVVVVLSFLNSAGTDGSFGNEDSERSVLSVVGRSIVPIFEPLGINDSNWPATVGIFTGIFAKEAVVGTLNALYSSLDQAEDAGTDAGEPTFDLLGQLSASVATIPENMAGLGDLVADPLGFGTAGLDSKQAAASAQGISPGTFAAMTSRFDGPAGAFAYLLLILLYVPCVAALGAINREIGAMWTLFASGWMMGIAYAVSVSFYQTATFGRHPMSSAGWILAMSTLLAVTIAVMRLVGHQRQQLSPLPAAE
jgi:ferrous iron transport protein B